jgi:hypothetical protein
MQDINEMMYKHKGFNRKKTQAGENHSGVNKTNNQADVKEEGDKKGSLY